jgi:hypothetical protein
LNKDKEVLIQLASFGRELQLRKLIGPLNTDCVGIGHMAYHMMTRVSRIPIYQAELPSQQQKMLKLNRSRHGIKLESDFSSAFIDFLETCFISSDLRHLAHVM